MITYHQIFDIYHTIFRILKILNYNSFSEIEKDRLRLFDFFYVFPHDFKNVKVPIDAKGLKTFYKENKFNVLPDRKRIFTQTSKYFEASIYCMLSYGMLDIDKFKVDIVQIRDTELAKKILDSNEDLDKTIIENLYRFFFKMPLTEFKKRTDLIEYRYDISETK